ncbi:endolytic transglycosylase MltG [Bacillus sp. FJAT-42315]|uniref:endolytic transglycosylase MltG n=1 Tax=Bacillus sp. FJAT-42315 TaxID=2014077 RepID=UPI000C24FAD9|nr:endolytic transglycosylase MltG [Bacillus sp. FJAT-42315]
MSKQLYLQPPGRKRRLKKSIIFMIITFFLAIGGATAGIYFFVQSALQPVDKNDQTPIPVSIPIGSSLSVIADQLEQKGVVKNAEIFKYYVKYKGEDHFQAGNYSFHRAMTIDELIEMLKTGKVVAGEVELAIPEGYQLSQIAEIISKETGRSQSEILKVMNDPQFIKQMIRKYPELLTEEILAEKIKYPLEGYLYPATYHYGDKKKPVKEIIEDMIKKTDSVLAQYRPSMAAKKMTAHQLLTMSSLIEKEATEKSDRRKISSVFYNRLAENMPLQTDPTVLYALGKHKSRVYYKDLKVESPYNTYKVKGLTPGPISNSGVSSVEAALNPETTDYLYFLASPAGDVYYSKTLEEHNQLKEKYITNAKQQ